MLSLFILLICTFRVPLNFFLFLSQFFKALYSPFLSLSTTPQAVCFNLFVFVLIQNLFFFFYIIFSSSLSSPFRVLVFLPMYHCFVLILLFSSSSIIYSLPVFEVHLLFFPTYHFSYVSRWYSFLIYSSCSLCYNFLNLHILVNFL